MGVYIWKEGTPTSYDIEDIIVDMPSSYPSGRLGSFVIDYEITTVVGEHGIGNISMYGDGSGNVSFDCDAYHLLNMYFYNGESIRIGLDDPYSYRTVLSHSGTITLDMDNKTYSIDVTVLLDGDETVPLQTSGSFTGDDIGVVNRLMGTSYQATFTGDVTLITGGGETPLSSAHIGEPMQESYIIPDLSTSYNGTIPAGDAIKKIRIIFNVTNNLEWYGNGSIGSGSYSSISGSGIGIGLPGSLWVSFSTAQLQGTVEYDFNTSNATWDLTNGSGGTEAGSQGFYGWSLDGTQSIPITWIPQTWSTPPTGTIEIRVER